MTFVKAPRAAAQDAWIIPDNDRRGAALTIGQAPRRPIKGGEAMPDPVLERPAVSTARPGFRNLLTYVDGRGGDSRRLAAATELARADDGHVTVVAVGYDASVGPYAFDGGAGAALLELSARAKKDAVRLASEVEAALSQTGALGEAIPVVAGSAEAPARFAAHARYADLVIAVPEGDGALSRIDRDYIEAALFEGDAPVLFKPDGSPAADGGAALIGWDGSREAMHAVRRSMPALVRAEKAEIAIFGDVAEEEAPGEQLALMLSRYGISVEIASHPEPSGTVAEALARRAIEIGAGLTIVGAYGHSRFREAIIGGVTRDILDRCRVPVFMAH